jgi:hypothetical protein
MGKNGKPGSVEKITKISLDSDIVACLKRKPVPTPIWEAESPGQDKGDKDAHELGIHLYDGYGSQRPGVMVIDDKQHPGLTVTVEVDNIDNYQNPSLSGALNFGNQGQDKEVLEAPEAMLTRTTFKSTLIDKTSNTLIFYALPDPMPDQFYRLYGLVSWSLNYETSGSNDNGKMEKDLGETYLEIFWIYGTPGKMYKKGVWVEVLRLLDLECFGLLSQKEVIHRVVNFCFGGLGLRYDVFMGASHYVYGWRGGGFDLKAYLDKTHSFCNCYDQAGAVQTLLGALGIHVRFVSLYPFGFLRQTELVGRGRINNPFIYSREDKQMLPGILPPNDDNRSAFGEHGFCIWDNGNEEVVLDACAGPYLGNHNIQSYLESTIDGITELYKYTQGLNKPGTISDIKIHPGVTDVHSLPIIPGIPDDKTKNVELDKSIIEENKDKGLILDIGGIDGIISKFLQEKLGWRECELNKRFRRGFDTASQEWSYRGAHQYLEISILVSNNIQSPLDLFQMMAASSQLRNLNKGGLKTPVNNEQDISWFTPYYKITMWYYYNLFVKMVGYNIPSYLFQSLQASLKKKILENSLVDLLDVIPSFKDFRVKVKTSGPKVFVGSDISIQICPLEDTEGEDQYAVEFFYSGDGLTLIGEQATTGLKIKKDEPFTELTFKCMNYGFTGVGLVIVDRTNLLCSKPHWEIFRIF